MSNQSNDGSPILAGMLTVFFYIMIALIISKIFF